MVVLCGTSFEERMFQNLFEYLKKHEHEFCHLYNKPVKPVSIITYKCKWLALNNHGCVMKFRLYCCVFHCRWITQLLTRLCSWVKVRRNSWRRNTVIFWFRLEPLLRWMVDIWYFLYADIEPWTFEQHLGEAVFIPAGCPYQVRNRQVKYLVKNYFYSQGSALFALSLFSLCPFTDP